MSQYHSVLILLAVYLCVVYSTSDPRQQHQVDNKDQLTDENDWLKIQSASDEDGLAEDVEKRAGIRNPYSWLNQANRAKRSRNPYSWMAMQGLDDEAPITYGYHRSYDKKSRNPYAWVSSEYKRTRNPYSWMNFVQ